MYILATKGGVIFYSQDHKWHSHLVIKETLRLPFFFGEKASRLLSFMGCFFIIPCSIQLISTGSRHKTGWDHVCIRLRISVHRRHAPISKAKTKPRTNQPKRVIFASEYLNGVWCCLWWALNVAKRASMSLRRFWLHLPAVFLLPWFSIVFSSNFARYLNSLCSFIS